MVIENQPLRHAKQGSNECPIHSPINCSEGNGHDCGCTPTQGTQSTASDQAPADNTCQHPPPHWGELLPQDTPLCQPDRRSAYRSLYSLNIRDFPNLNPIQTHHKTYKRDYHPLEPKPESNFLKPKPESNFHPFFSVTKITLCKCTLLSRNALIVMG